MTYGAERLIMLAGIILIAILVAACETGDAIRRRRDRLADERRDSPPSM